jgi:hypothetical protein
MLKLVHPKPFPYTPYRPEVVVTEEDPLTPAERLLEKLILNDRHLREYIERRAQRGGLTVRQHVKTAFSTRP